MIGKVYTKKSGGRSANVVNGIIEQYLAENSTIDANTFVEFVNHFQDNTIVNDTNSSQYISAVLVDTNKVFIAHKKGNYLGGIICTINNDTISTGTDTNIISVNNSYFYEAVVLINTNKVFIAHRKGSYLAGIVCTISGTTITVGTDTQLSSTSNSYINIKVAQIDTNKVFITYGYDAFYGMVCTINGTTITAGTSKIFSALSIANYVSLIKISTSKVFITFRNSESIFYLRGMICTINGTTITAGTDIQLSSNNYTVYDASTTLIDTNKVFIAHSGNGNNALAGIVCTINGTTITAGTDTLLIDTTFSSHYASITQIDTNKVFIAHKSDTTNKYLNGIVCIVNGTTIDAGTDITITTSTLDDSTAENYRISTTLIDTNKVFIAHQNNSSNYYLNGIIIYIYGMDVLSSANNRTIKPSVDKIHGLTKTSGTNISPADVWVLDNE